MSTVTRSTRLSEAIDTAMMEAIDNHPELWRSPSQFIADAVSYYLNDLHARGIAESPIIVNLNRMQRNSKLYDTFIATLMTIVSREIQVMMTVNMEERIPDRLNEYAENILHVDDEVLKRALVKAFFDTIVSYPSVYQMVVTSSHTALQQVNEIYRRLIQR